ncbi:hypothetical protein RKE29_09130 [Streptomyces sp. B1866]|uniref:hypothetical protein n=1 Tax=Streptomyces sp. B1866 TaxID=3075431 RepID=UPI00289192E4|nr:hypothetical protein [Streptomyces sp. B1866]MDT3396802.1 hypothetical protein [Streptomyces sp. B1866]
MINPDAIPQYTGDLAQLEKDYADLKTDAGHIRDTGAAVHSRFQGLSAYYRAPEAEQLFATTHAVKDRADGFADNLEKVSSALSDYAAEIRPLVSKLAQLKSDATRFVNDTKNDDDWQYDGDKVDEHNRLRDDITATVAAFWAAERTCHNKITALFGGTQMVAGDGSDRKDQYGFDADDMKNAKVPWGDPVEEKHHWYEAGHWIKSFVWDGLIVDGVWGTIKGLGTLVGFGGWDAMGQAWKGLAQLGTGLAITTIPGAGAAFWALPDDKLPGWLRDSRTAMKQTGKALVAWDEWGKNPGRAAGAVTFNVVTTVFTGGAGGAASGAGKAGAVARTLSLAGKAGRVIDPMAYIAKGAGAGLSKVGDIAKGLRGVGNIEIPRLPDNAVTLPEGSLRLPDGTVRLPEGADVPQGAVQLPDGTVKVPDGVPALPEGATRLPTDPGQPARYFDRQGNYLDEHGNVLGDVGDAPRGGSPTTGPASATDIPRTGTPDQEPALAGAGAHVPDAPVQAVRTGDSLGGIGRAGDDLPTAGRGDHLPGGQAGDHLPGGHAGDHGPGPSASHEPPAGHTGGPGDGPTGGHGDGPGGGGHEGPVGGHQEGPAGGGHDTSAGGHADGPGSGGGHEGPPPPGDSPAGPGDRKPGLIRQDDHFTAEHNAKGQRKAHLNAHGDLVPANPDGNASVVDHVVGRDPAKSDSPFISLSSEGAHAKAFGSNRIRVDLERLERDLASGRLQGVEVYPPERVQSIIQENADRIAGRHVDLTIPPGSTKAQAEEYARSLGLSNSKAKRIAQRMVDMMNTKRDQEWLIKGVVPREYIEGPFSG